MSPTPRTVGFKAGERNVFLHLLTACNLACRHCYINPAEHGRERLSRERLLRWIELFARPGQSSNLILLGGEPTLHPDLPLAIERAKSLGYRVTVDTNGFLFHDFLNQSSPALLDYLSFSLDGPNPAINDPIRGQGVFAACTRGIGEARRLGYTVSVIYTVSRNNIAALAQMVPLLEELGVKKFFIQVLGLRGSSAGGDQAQVSRAEWLATVPAVAQDAAARGIHVIYPKVFLEAEEKFECAGLVAENYFIFPNGRVYQCPLCEDHPIHAYRITADDLLEVRPGLTEARFFPLAIPEGCVMNRLLQPGSIEYDREGRPLHRISCCLLKEEVGGETAG
jgi:MoaA/NifB/PqqE/SkfB family radical SAM enzyme